MHKVKAIWNCQCLIKYAQNVAQHIAELMSPNSKQNRYIQWIKNDPIYKEENDYVAKMCFQFPHWNEPGGVHLGTHTHTQIRMRHAF